MKQAVILAGGKGTRLQERLNGLPKPLIDICGKPLLGRQIDLLNRYGYQEVLILVNHESEKIVRFCKEYVPPGMSIQCIDDGLPLGTAGSVIAVWPKLASSFLVMYGDTLLDVDLKRFEKFHLTNHLAHASLFLHPNDHPVDSDLVEISHDGRITAFKPYPHIGNTFDANLVNAGLYYLNKELLVDWLGSTKLLDFGKDVFPSALKKNDFLQGYISPEYIKDCGTPKRLDKVCADFSSGRVSRSNLELPQRVVFLDRDGTLNELNGHISDPAQLNLLPGASEAISRLNRSSYLSILATNQPVLARGECSMAELKTIHNKLETLLGNEGAYLDRIEFCPHHPDSGFVGEVGPLKTKCNCRKPAIGMITKVAKDWNIDLGASWFIGDSSTDFLAAYDAGVKSIGVETGMAGLDGRYAIGSNFAVPDVLPGVQFILDIYPKILRECHGLVKDVIPGDWVLIGGLSRSGKSNFAQCYKDALVEKGLNSTIISVDSWLKAEIDRGQGVLGRYNLEALRHWVSNHLNEPLIQAIPPAYYDRKHKLPRKPAREQLMDSSQVVIIEGTLALLLADLIPKRRSHFYFVELDEGIRRERVINHYLLRGVSAVQAQEVYLSRQADESPIINGNLPTNTHRINLNLQMN
jgi:histidinol-phosphate phosphatase family protein